MKKFRRPRENIFFAVNTYLETGKYYKKNSRRLEEVQDAVWAAAIEKCRVHICMRIGGRTKTGAHTATRLGMDPVEYYLTYAYDALIFGTWEWKEDYSLSQQMIRIIESTISTEVEKVKTKKAAGNTVVSTDPNDFWFAADSEDAVPDMIKEILDTSRLSKVESWREFEIKSRSRQ